MLPPEAIKVLEENIGGKLLNVGFGKDFLDVTPKAQAIIAKTDKWDYFKLKSFCVAKEIIDEVKRQST